MKTVFLTILLFISFLTGNAQELSLHELYNRTNQISALSNQGAYLEALDRADVALKQYADFEGADMYKAYVYLYKATSFMALGDLMLARHCDSLALHYSRLIYNKELGFLIRNNMAVIEMDRKNYQACYDQCSGLLMEPDYHPGVDQKLMILNNMALSAFKLGLNKVADSLYPILIEKASSNAVYSAFDPALAYRNYGQYLMKQGDGHQAKKMLQFAFGFYRDSLGDMNAQTGQTALYLGQCYQLLNQNDSAGLYFNEAIRILDADRDSRFITPNAVEAIQAYLGRARYYFDLGQINQSIRDIEMAMHLIDKVMGFYAASESGVILAGLVRPVYNLAVELYVKIALEQQDDNLLLQAVLCSDRGKRLSLQSRSFSLRNSFLSKEWELAYREYVRARLAIEQPGGPGGIEEESQQFSKAKALLDSVCGQKSTLRFDRELEDLRIKDLPRPLLVFHDFEFSYGVFKINRNKISYHELQLTDELSESIQTFKNLLAEQRSNHYSRSDFEKFTAMSASLSQQFVPFIDPEKEKRFYIQTDGIFHGFPFEALIDPDYTFTDGGTFSDFRDLPYLLGDKHVHYLVSLRKKIKRSSDGGWIQFSGHSFVDTLHYKTSELAGGYDWYDILQQDYHGRSVFLNSCETGVGLYQPGEGLMSLGSAFFLSGADQVIETRWKYPEGPAHEIARLFYRHGGHRNPAKALHRAINDYLKDCPPGADHPHYWAGISVQGYCYSKSGSPIFLVVFLFLIIILVVLIKN